MKPGIWFELARTALHPRLKSPMRPADLAFFVAEHDDHHLAWITWLHQQAVPDERGTRG